MPFIRATASGGDANVRSGRKRLTMGLRFYSTVDPQHRWLGELRVEAAMANPRIEARWSTAP